MAYVTITKDLTEVKDKVAFGLTKRQIVCFSLGGIAGVGTYFLTRHSFSRSYGVILPSSLTMLLPSALGFSPHPPVSVYGRSEEHTSELSHRT